MKRILLASLILLVSCSRKEHTEDPDNPSLGSTNYIVETAINTISAAIDDQTGETMVASQSINNTPLIYQMMVQKATADNTCGRAVTQACSDGKRSLDYSACSSGNYTYQGNVQLNYSQNNCSFATDGDTVTRVSNGSFYGPHGGILMTSTDNYYDYSRNQYGGGTRITRVTGGDYRADILGRHAQVIIRGYLASDISMRTLSPIFITQGLSRTNRQLDGGVIQLAHNVFQFKATMNLTNIKYSAGCCYPVSGSIDIQYTDRRTGSSNVTFNGCGVGTVTDNGVSAAFKMTYCE